MLAGDTKSECCPAESAGCIVHDERTASTLAAACIHGVHCAPAIRADLQMRHGERCRGRCISVQRQAACVGRLAEAHQTGSMSRPSSLR